MAATMAKTSRVFAATTASANTFSHNATATSADYLHILVNGDVVFSQTGAATNRNAAWTTESIDLDVSPMLRQCALDDRP